MRDRQTASAALVLLLGMGVTGCKSLAKGATEEFAADFTCPADRVEVRPRTDIQPNDLRRQKPPAPPADVAADPERLALFLEQQKKKADAANRLCEVFEARGCGNQVLYCCRHASQNRGARAGQISCDKSDYPEGVAKW